MEEVRVMLGRGDTAVYSRTGTMGKVVRILELNGKTWAELDTTGLLYEINTLETAAEGPKAKKQTKKKAGRSKVAELEEMKDEGSLDSSANIGGAG
jgi:hypothetical protein